MTNFTAKAPDGKSSKFLNGLNISHVAGGFVLFAAALLYLLTLDNGLRPDELVGGDLITHQYAQVEARPSNAPGYPLYIMGGWLWFHLARTGLGGLLNPVEILSLYSTLWGLASLLVLYLILLRVTHGQWFIALPLTAFYATTFFFWYYSVTTEQYTSAIFQTLLIVWLVFKWDDHPRHSILLWLAFISGTMLANMVTTLFILPPLLWFIFFRREVTGDRRGFILSSYLKRPKFILQAVGLACLPLLSYVYVYIRGAQHPEWRGVGQWATTWEWFVQFLTIQQGRDELAPGLTLQNPFTAEFPALMWQELTWPIFFGGLLGLVFLGRRRAIFLYATLLIYFIFCWGYRFGNWFQVIIPAYPIIIVGFATLALWVRHSLFATLALRVRHSPFAYSPHWSYGFAIPLFLTLLLMGLLIYRFTASLPRANQQNRPGDTGLDSGWTILADAPIQPAVISGDFAEQVALQYLSVVWEAAPRIYPTDAGDLTLPPGLEEKNLRVYISRRALAAVPEVVQVERIHPQAWGEQLIALWPTPRTELPAEAIPLNINFGHKLALVGWEQTQAGHPLPETVAQRLTRANWQIALYWQAITPLTEDYTISVRPLAGGQLITVDGEAVIQDHQPVWGVYPTRRWEPGEIVRDAYALSLPSEVTPEAVQVIVYKTTETGFENLAEKTINLATALTVPH